MLVILRLVAGLLPVVLMGLYLHALLHFFLQSLDAVHHHKYGDIPLHALQHVLQPDLRLAAVADEQVAVLDAQYILGRGLEAVGLGAGGDQQADRSLLAGYFPGKVKGGKHSGDYAERAAAALITAALTAAERQDKGQYQ